MNFRVPDMPTFCTKCGSPLSGPFCVKCGAAAQLTNTSPATQPVAAAPQAPVATATTATPKSSALAKILVGFAVVVVLIGALAAGGIYYAVHRVKQKVHEMADEVPGLRPLSGSGSKSSDGDGDSKMSALGAACRYLSKEEVSKAIGIEIVAVQSDSDNDCAYLAHGTSADMTAKHMSAMVAAKGADAQGRKMTEQFAGGLFKALEAEHGDSNQDSAGNVPVVTFSIDNNSAETQMRLNAKVAGNLGPAPKGLPGIGDEAFDMAGTMVMMRKGDKLVRIMYSMCPCAVDAIKPLAKTLAGSL